VNLASNAEPIRPSAMQTLKRLNSETFGILDDGLKEIIAVSNCR
jgi:hypothetical protein